jgi:hypothetical protein
MIVTHVRMIHKADIYEKTTTTTAAGQRKPVWSLKEGGVRCAFIPQFNDNRNYMTSPVYAHNEIISFAFNGDADIDFTKRLYNIVDRFDNVLEAGPIEITSIIKVPGFYGRIHHIEVSGYRVIDE